MPINEVHYARMCKYLDGAIALSYFGGWLIYVANSREFPGTSAFWKISMIALAVFMAIQTTTFTMLAFIQESTAYSTYEQTVLYYGDVLVLGLLWAVFVMLMLEDKQFSMNSNWTDFAPGLSALNTAMISIYLTLSAIYSTDTEFLHIRKIVLTW